MVPPHVAATCRVTPLTFPVPATCNPYLQVNHSIIIHTAHPSNASIFALYGKNAPMSSAFKQDSHAPWMITGFAWYIVVLLTVSAVMQPRTWPVATSVCNAFKRETVTCDVRCQRLFRIPNERNNRGIITSAYMVQEVQHASFHVRCSTVREKADAFMYRVPIPYLPSIVGAGGHEIRVSKQTS